MLKNKIFPALLLLSNFTFAQELVKDINTVSGSQIDAYNIYEPYFCVPCGNYVFFKGTDAIHGRELWRTDGTAEGTILVKDLWQGPNTGLQPGTEMFCLNDQLIFRSNGIWKSDGTEAGTSQVTLGFTNGLVPFEGKIAFKDDNKLYVATTDQQGVIPTSVYTYGTGPNEYTNTAIIASEHHVFTSLVRVSTQTNQITSLELWGYDGTSSTLLKSKNTSGPLELITTVEDKLIFSFYDEGNGKQFWVSDGTVAGTKLLIPTGLNTSLYEVMYGINVNGKALLGAGGIPGTWLSDGTPEGTNQLIDSFTTYEAKIFNNKIYLLGNGNDGAHGGAFIKRLDMNFTNPVNITEASDDYITFSAIAGNKLLFNDNELFSIDASDNVSLAKDINPGESPSYPRYGSALENQVIFLADDGTHGFEMWKTDGTEAGTSLVKDVASNTAGSQAGDIYRYNDKLYFQATSSISDGFYKQLWESDGTEAGTRKINETIHDDLIFAPVKNYIVTIDDDRKFVKTNLSTGVTSTLTNLPSNSFGGGKPLHSIAVNNDVYFYFSSALTQGGPDTGLELWRANPFTNELDQPKDIKPGFQGTYVSDGIKGIALNGKLIFSVDENADYKTEPWVTDGTETGTFKLKDIADGTSANPVYFKTVGNRAIFIANDENYLVSLWSTDGTSAGTVLLKEGANYEPAAVLNGKGIFGISNPTGAPEIWTTDGTVSGTSLLAIVGTENDNIYNFVSTESKVYFVMNSQDLWETDGTVDGTRKTNVSIQSLNIATHTTWGETLIFLSEGKLWATLGDLSATETIAETDVQSEMFVIGGYVYFLKDDETYGRELFKVEIPELVITGTDQEESAEKFKIFPNPTAKTLFVKAESPAVLRIIDMNGREKHNQFITGDVGIDVSNYADGLYVVTLNGRQQKFIKRH